MTHDEKACVFRVALEKVATIIEDRGTIDIGRFREALDDTCGSAAFLKALPDEYDEAPEGRS